MDGNIRIGIVTESGILTAAIERALSRDDRFEVRVLEPASDDLRAFGDLDLLLVGRGLPRGGALRLLGRSWVDHRFPRILFLHGRSPASAEATLTTASSDELTALAESAVRARGPIPARVTLRFLEPEAGAGGAEAVAVGR